MALPSAERRGDATPGRVIRGMIVGVGPNADVSDLMNKALVQLASPDEMASLSAGPVRLTQPDSAVVAPMSYVGEPVYIREPKTGTFEPVGILTNVEVRTETIDVTTFGGGVEFMPGRRIETGKIEGWL